MLRLRYSDIRRSPLAHRCSQLSRINLQKQQRSFVDFPSITGCVQSSIIGLHSMTGLPWWATFATSTVILRIAMFPLVYRQILASRKLAGAVPELNFLFQLLRQRLKSINPRQTSEHVRIIHIFFKGVRTCVKLHGISLLQILSSPLANMAVFLTFVYSLRELIIDGDANSTLGLTEGGLLWFQDLTTKDTSFLLPLAAIGVSYSALELAFRSPTARFILILKDTFQSLLFLSIPFVLPLPAGVFAYWIPSSICGVVQTLLLRNSAIQKILKIQPPRPSHLAVPKLPPQVSPPLKSSRGKYPIARGSK